jgi:uncharacterized protein (TIRG00374 family)
MVTKNRWSLFLRLTISLGLLMVLLWIMRNDIGKIAGILKNSNKVFFILAFLLGILLSMGLAFRLKLLLSGQGVLLHIKDIVYLTFIGYFFNNFFPTSIGGDIVKAHYASKKTNNKPASYAAVLIDRIIGFLSCLSIAIIGIIFIGRDLGNDRIIWVIASSSIMVVFIMVFLLNKGNARFISPIFKKYTLPGKLGEKLSKLYDAVNFYRHNVGLLIRAYLLGVFLHGCSVVTIYFFILSIGGDIHVLRLFLIIPLVWAVSMLPSLNGLGVRESAFVYFLKGEIGADLAFSLSLLWLGLIILYSIIGGVLHLLFPVKVERNYNERGI